MPALCIAKSANVPRLLFAPGEKRAGFYFVTLEIIRYADAFVKRFFLFSEFSFAFRFSPFFIRFRIHMLSEHADHLRVRRFSAHRIDGIPEEIIHTVCAD